MLNKNFLSSSSNSPNTYIQREVIMGLNKSSSLTNKVVLILSKPQPITKTQYFTINISTILPKEILKATPGVIRTTVKMELHKSLSTKEINLRRIIRDF